MGTLPRLVEALEIADGRTKNALSSFAYVCRKEGLLSLSPIGRGASNATLKDAANLLIASSVPVPLRLMPAAVKAFRALPRSADATAFPMGKGKRPLTLPGTAGELLELLIESAPIIPDDVRVEFRFGSTSLSLFAGLGQKVVVDYFKHTKIGLDPPGGDRSYEQRVTYGIRTLRLVHDAVT